MIFQILSICALIGLAAAVTSLMCKARILDKPNHRSSHDRPVASSGGVAIVLTSFVGIAGYVFLQPPPFFAGSGIEGLAIALFVIAIIGFLDDLGRLRSFREKLATQIAAAAILLFFDIVIRKFTFPGIGDITLGWWGYPVTLIWVVGLTNAFNFMDGLNGLAAGTAIICLGFFGLAGWFAGATDVVVISCVLLSACAGFLPFNFPRARIFMGDVGSQFLGFFLAALAVIAADSVRQPVPVFVMPLLFLHFIFDTAFTFFRRLACRENVTQAHRSHLYQLLNRCGWSHKRVTGLLCGFACIQGLGALLLLRWLTQGQLIVISILLAVQVAYLAVVMKIARRNKII
jgi:UDP-GlcNAc:undecaprenyl-phosphate GlcNAc-1-phosphate transferase